MFTIVTVENSANAQILVEPAERVQFPLAEEDRAIIAQMKETLIKLQGVGLAAPQIGISKQIMVYRITEEMKATRQEAEVVPLTVLINPVYKPAKASTLFHDWEACFSVLKTTGKVPRYHSIEYTAQDMEGQTIHAIEKGFNARVLQHEIDHLQGVLITDRLTKDCVQGDPQEMLKVRFQELTPEQKNIVKKIMEEREKNLDPNDKAHAEYLASIKLQLED